MFGMKSYEIERYEEKIQILENKQEDIAHDISDVIELLMDFDFDNLQEAIEMLTKIKEGIK